MDEKTKQLIETRERCSRPDVPQSPVDVRDLCAALHEQDERIATLTAKLAEAIELAGEAIPYVSDYFREKYGLDKRLAKLAPTD
jgi:hypothetical protein